KKMIRVLLAAALLGTATLMWAQGGFELTPTIGYRFGGNIDLVNATLNPNFRKLQIESNPAYGVALNHGVHDNIQVEFQWSRQDTHVDGRSRADNTSTRLFGAYLDQYHANFSFHPADDGSRTQPFAILGLRASSFNPRAPVSRTTHFSSELGAGIHHLFSPPSPPTSHATSTHTHARP